MCKINCSGGCIECAPEEHIKNLQEQVTTLTKERDFLLGKELLGSNALAAAQTTNAKLREVIKPIAEGTQPCDWNGWQMKSDRKIAREALALPNDTSALDARLAQERERCAKVCEALLGQGNGVGDCVEAIRSMK